MHELMLEKKLEALTGFCQQQQIPYYIHAGFACYLHGTYDKLDDIDVRLYHQDIYYLNNELSNFLKEPITLRSPIYFHDRAYLNAAIIWNGEPKVEICTEIITARDGWVYRLPFNETIFSSSNVALYNHKKYNVASLNSLMLYYLTCRRQTGHFNDRAAIKSLAAHKDFNILSFYNSIEGLYYHDNVSEIFQKSLL